ncbi:MAG: aminotransferase class I/II-fold pyridoxal phosphate-dependent enzyme [Eubacteriaceae bacterium]|nr:aminotransferase class I/II-fold pyridoxal phosphate-dependent enzyme [Eubacteriaceae bacterium]
MIFAQENNRQMPKEDKIFAISGKAKTMIAEKGKDAVVNATIGSLLDDNGDLAILSSVVESINRLKPLDYAEYAPIGGIPAFKQAVKKAAFGENFSTGRYTEVCATPGGTGAIRNTISNYSKPGDKVLTSDWFWAPYKTISQEIGRDIDTYPLFSADGKFNIEGFSKKVSELTRAQGELVILLNTPAHNPTGYSLSDSDWDGVIDCINTASSDGRITLFVDAAYIDFAGDEEKYRSFLPKLEELGDNVLPIIGYSASKTLTLYGMRCGAMICLAKSEAVAAEFKQVTEYSSRGSWSNCVRAGQTVLADIYNSPELMAKVGTERAKYRDMLITRGKTFEKVLREEGLENVPFDAGFFTCIACDDPDAVSTELMKDGIFTVPLAKGIRISVASISEEKCIRAAKGIAKVMK